MPHLDASLQPDDQCFPGTGVPVRLLVDHLTQGGSLEEFLDGYPEVDETEAEQIAGQLGGERG